MATSDLFTAGVVLLVLSIIHLLMGVPFALYVTYKLVREQRPEQWAALGGISAFWWIVFLIFGWTKRVPANVRSPSLSATRALLGVGLFDLLAALGMIAWATLRW